MQQYFDLEKGIEGSVTLSISHIDRPRQSQGMHEYICHLYQIQQQLNHVL